MAQLVHGPLNPFDQCDADGTENHTSEPTKGAMRLDDDRQEEMNTQKQEERPEIVQDYDSAVGSNSNSSSKSTSSDIGRNIKSIGGEQGYSADCSSCDSSSSESLRGFHPGEWVSMEDSLSFNRTARVVIQAKSPFLAVHVNAAFSRLTGVQNSTVIGRPLSTILTILGQIQDLPEKRTSQHKNNKRIGNKKNAQSAISNSFSNDNGIAATRCIWNRRAETRISIERLIASNCYEVCYMVNILGFEGGAITSPYQQEDVHNNRSGSRHSSISSKDVHIKPTLCTMSMCPVMKNCSQRPSCPKRSCTSRTTPTSKRRKYDKNPDEPLRRYQLRQQQLEASHFVIQLFLSEKGDDEEGDAIEDRLETIPTNVSIDLYRNNV